MPSSNIDKSSIEILGQLFIALKSFEGKFDKKFNVSKLARYLHLNERDADYLVEFMIKFQEEFKEFSKIFNKYTLNKKRENGTLFITTERRPDIIPYEILIEKEHASWLSDLIYTFQHVKKGKGFDLSNKDLEVVKKITMLRKEHPYFFYKNGSDLLYPSRLGTELGNAILSCKKLNKQFECFTFHKHEIKVR